MKCQKKQMYPNSCGAACLLCAAKELGITMPLEINDTSETKIYAVTSDATIWPKPLRPAELNSAAYSTPDNLIFQARMLGLQGRIYIKDTLYNRALEWAPSEVLKRCEGSGIAIVREAAPTALNNNQRELKVVGVLKGVGLHYVLHSPDGTYINPADGCCNSTFDEMNNSFLKSYSDLNLSVVLEKQRND